MRRPCLAHHVRARELIVRLHDAEAAIETLVRILGDKPADRADEEF